MKRECIHCHKILSYSDFHRNKRYSIGITNRCKKCHSEYCKKHNAENKEINKLKHHLFYLVNKERLLAGKKAYLKTKAGRRYQKMNSKRMYKKYPEKIRARAKFHYYLKKGTIKRENCQTCGEKAEAHHPDYNKPLEVIWYCQNHHRQIEGRSSC